MKWITAGKSAVVVFILSSSYCIAQLAGSPAQKKELPPELSLTLTAGPLDLRGVPTEIHLAIENISDHPLRMPEPHFGCGSALTGYLDLLTGFIPAGQESVGEGVGTGCAACGGIPPDPMEVIKEWKTLDPGGRLEVKANPIARIDTKRIGTYSITVSYGPPQLPDNFRKTLESREIAYPTQNASSNTLTFTVDQ